MVVLSIIATFLAVFVKAQHVVTAFITSVMYY